MTHDNTALAGGGKFRPVALCLLAAMAMCYGWGWRGSYGHEAGAAVSGGLLGMAICLASGRSDWYRRTAVAGMFGAVGWAWGGTLTNMEFRLYIASDSPLDVTYGFFGIALVGMLWSGIGGAILAMAFTRSRSELNQYIGPILVVGMTFCLTFVFFFLTPSIHQAYGAYTEEYWHDGEWLAALQILLVMIPYWFLRPKDRPATTLILQCTVAWWIGYLVLIKWLEVYLAPPWRSEVWAGVVAVQLVLVWHHYHQRDRAALMFTLNAMATGSIAFIIALQVHVPFLRDWWIFRSLSSWKMAEETFGFLMGLGVAFGASRLLRHHVAPPEENTDARPLDILSVVVLLIALPWMNVKQNVEDWDSRYHVLPAEPLAFFDLSFTQLYAWQWFFLMGVLYTTVALYGLYLYLRGRLPLVPENAWGKGSVVFLLLIAISLAAVIAKRSPVFDNPSSVASGISFLFLAGVTVWLLLGRSAQALGATSRQVSATAVNDPKWSLGWKHGLVWVWIPIHIVLASQIALFIQEGHWVVEGQADDKERHRFGDRATTSPEMQAIIMQNRHEHKMNATRQEIHDLSLQLDELKGELVELETSKEGDELPSNRSDDAS